MNHILHFAGRIAYSHYEIVEHVYNTAYKLATEGPAGSFVECGVAAGSKIIAMAAALQQAGVKGHIYAYDSFEGIPLPTQGDDQKPGIKYLSEDEMKCLPEANETDKFLKSSGATVHGLDQVIANIRSSGLAMHNNGLVATATNDEFKQAIINTNFAKIICAVGWFENTVQHHYTKYANWPDDRKEPIAYLRLDGDMYSATKVCLENLYPLLASGGILEIDDYGLAGCRKAVDEYFEGKNIEWITVHPNSTVVYMQKK